MPGARVVLAGFAPRRQLRLAEPNRQLISWSRLPIRKLWPAEANLTQQQSQKTSARSARPAQLCKFHLSADESRQHPCDKGVGQVRPYDGPLLTAFKFW